MQPYIDKIQKEIDGLVKRLGAKTSALAAQEPYKYLTASNYIQYENLQKETRRIADKISSLEAAIDYIRSIDKEFTPEQIRENEDFIDYDDDSGQESDITQHEE
jgi:predicted  nucleic acid-binding Zn-ribbon protein